MKQQKRPDLITADDIRKAMVWECPVDQTSINSLCQLHEVHVDEKSRHTDEVAGPSRLLEKRDS